MKKWLDRLADALKRLAGKDVEALPAIVESVVGALLSFLGKAVEFFVANHICALIVFVAGLISVWLMQKVKKRVRSLPVPFLSSLLFSCLDLTFLAPF